MTRIPLIVVGAVLLVAGVVFALQGFNVLGGSAMSGTTVWAVLGPVIAQQAPAVAPDRRAVALDDGLERALVPVAREREQAGIRLGAEQGGAEHGRHGHRASDGSSRGMSRDSQ